MAERLNLSMSGYGKIERDETDLSISRLKEIAEVLETDYNTILNFDEKQVFNISHNQNTDNVVNGVNGINGIIHNQFLNDKEAWDKLFNQMKAENDNLKEIIEKLMKK